MKINKELIKSLRTERGWTQQHLADVVGLSLRTIQRIEKNGVTSLETVSALSSVFEVERRKIVIQIEAPVKPKLISGLALIGLVFISGLVLGASSVYFVFGD